MRRAIIAIFTPLARRMRAVHPTVMTATSLAAGVAAGVAFAVSRDGHGHYALAALLLAVSGAADSLDGIIARMYGRISAWGDFLDHFGDRIVEACVLAGIAFSPRASRSLGFAVVVVTLLHSYLGTQIEATTGERRREGPGKEEMFVSLVLFAIALAIFPRAAIGLAGRDVSLPDCYLAALGAFTLGAIAHRLVLARRLLAPGRPRE